MVLNTPVHYAFCIIFQCLISCKLTIVHHYHSVRSNSKINYHIIFFAVNEIVLSEARLFFSDVIFSILIFFNKIRNQISIEYLCTGAHAGGAEGSGVASPKSLGGQKFWGAKMFDFRRITLLVYKNASQSTK